MHSSRMRTARTLPYGDPLDRDLPPQRPPWTETPWTVTTWTVSPSGQRTPWTEDPTPRQRLPWTESPQTETHLDRDSPWTVTPLTSTPRQRPPGQRQNLGKTLLTWCCNEKHPGEHQESVDHREDD